MFEENKLMSQLISYRSKSNFKAVYARNGMYAPYEYFATWQEGTSGFLGVANVAVPNALSVLYRYDDVKDIAVCMDGSWHRTGDGFIFVTRVPIVAIVKTDGVHIIDTSNNIRTVINYQCDKVSIVRGWKSMVDDEDMGILVAAYTESAVKVFSCIATDNGISSTEVYSTVATNISNVNIGLLADYRARLEISADTSMLFISERLYVSGAVLPDNVHVTLSSISNNSYATYISTTEVTQDNSIANISLTDVNREAVAMYSRIPTSFIAHNVGDTKIVIELDGHLANSTAAGITIKCGSFIVPYSAVIASLSTITLLCPRFNNYIGEFTIMYDGNGLYIADGTPLGSFTTSFMPIGLIPDDTEPPEIVSIHNKEMI